MVCIAAGYYAKFTSTILKDLIKLIDLNYLHLGPSKSSFKELYTKVNILESDDVNITRVKEKLLTEQVKSKGESIETFLLQ